MTGAGRAIAVLTSGGDAQGHHKVNHIALKSLKTQEAMLLLFVFRRLCLDGLVFNGVLKTVKLSVGVKGRVDTGLHSLFGVQAQY